MRTLLKKSWRILLFLLIIAGCLYLLRPGYERYVEHEKEIERLKAEIKDLESERAQLEKQMQALKDEDPEQIERIAREKLHLTKPGETVFRFKKKPETPETP
jgi:cell division protein FtsB